MKARIIFGFVLLLAVMCILFLLVVTSAEAMTLQERSFGGGDCHAQLATGDTYKSEVDSSCITSITGNNSVTLLNDKGSVNLETGSTVQVYNVTTGNPSQDDNPTVNPSTDTPSNDKPDKNKKNCNKGFGNGGEGCDSGNNPDKGNDDESGEGKNKKDK